MMGPYENHIQVTLRLKPCRKFFNIEDIHEQLSEEEMKELAVRIKNVLAKLTLPKWATRAFVGTLFAIWNGQFGYVDALAIGVEGIAGISTVQKNKLKAIYWRNGT